MKNGKELFQHYPLPVRRKLLSLRALIIQVAKKTKDVGPLEESLRWGQPSYLTSVSRSGTTLRIDQHKGDPRRYALYVHCQTDLISKFKKILGNKTEFEGNRAVVFDVGMRVPEKKLAECIALALTYHLRE